MYKPARHWLWDFWLVAEGPRQHLFYLQAPDDLADAEQRHPLARIGHAVSEDLRQWQELGQVFGSDPAPAWDDRCTWTGSILPLPQNLPDSAPPGSRYAMLYTGTNQREGSAIQRVGLAWSADLQHWQRHHPSLVLQHPASQPQAAGTPASDLLGPNPHHADEQAWRDPDLHYDAQRGVYQALLTAQLPGGDGNRGQGAIVCCESGDLLQWQPPSVLFASPAFFLMEIPQRWRWGNYEYLLFSAVAEWVKPQHMGAEFADFQPQTGTYYVCRRRGDKTWQQGGLLWGQPDQMQFGFKLVQHQGECWGLYWQGYDPAGRFHGCLSDPYPISQNKDGRLHVSEAQP